MVLHIGVDAWNLTGDRRGIGRYVREILRCWALWQPQRLRVSLLVPEHMAWFARRRYLKEIDDIDLPVRYRGAANRSLDAVWYPWNGMSWVGGHASVATLHDASLFSLPPDDPQVQEREQRPFLVAVKHARRIITASQFAKAELVRYLALDPSMVDVISHGVGEPFLRPQKLTPADMNSRYVLFVGEPERRKGLTSLLRAMEILPPELGRKTELLVAGASGQYPLPTVPESIRLRNLGWVDDTTLASIYAQAAVFVYPSEYEGFGLPVLEAMAAGAPVIASDTPSSREAGGDAALYVPATDAAALARTITSVLTNPNVAQNLRARGREHVKDMTWEVAAKKTLAVLERAAREPARMR